MSDRPAAERGTLEIKDRVIEKVLTGAASAVDGTVVHADNLQRISGRGFPRADVTSVETRAWVTLDVAASWPCDVGAIGSRVQDEVKRAAAHQVAITIEKLDVVVHVVDEAPTTTGRRVQ